MIQERGASAKRAQADHSRRKSLTSSSSQEPRAMEKLAAMFSSGNEEPGNQLKSSIFKNADPSNLGRSLLVGNKDHLLEESIYSSGFRGSSSLGSLSPLAPLVLWMIRILGVSQNNNHLKLHIKMQKDVSRRGAGRTCLMFVRNFKILQKKFACTISKKRNT